MSDARVLVSVITPVHNGAHFIEGAIASVLEQDVPLEMLVIDDGSQDNIDEVMASYADKPEIRYLKNPENLGVARTRNRGVQEARGKYVAFLDCDDWWEKGKLRKQLELMQKEKCVLCATGRRLVTPEGEKTDRVIGVKTRLTYKDLLFQNPVNCSSVVLRRKAALEFPMEHDDCHEDYIMWLNVLKKYHRACAIDEPLLNYRLSNTGKSGSKLKSAGMTFKVYRYMGFGMVKSLICFAGYSINGVKKYYFGRKGR